MAIRNILLLVVGVIGLALVRNLVREITRFMARKMAGAASAPGTGPASKPRTTSRLEKDPHTGTYVDPALAVRATVGGSTFYFESESSRNAFLKARRAKA